MSYQHFTREQLQEFKEAFKMFDRDGNGKITADEISSVMRSCGDEPSDKDLQEMLEEADIDGNGTIDFHEFLNLMDNLRGGAAGGNNSQLLREFRKIDKDMNGYITRSELMEVLKATGEKFTKKDIDDMMASADADGDGKVNYQEFVQIMHGN